MILKPRSTQYIYTMKYVTLQLERSLIWFLVFYLRYRLYN